MTDGSTRPDLVVRLPGGGEILVDAKFPFDAYWLAIGAEDPVQRDELMRKHAADVLLRVRELSGKRYSDSSVSPDFVVMFLPLESLLSASLEADGLLLEKAFERRVVLATPTTMLALLRTVGFGYQRKLMADNAEEIRAGRRGDAVSAGHPGRAPRRPAARPRPGRARVQLASSARSTARPCARPDGWPISAWSPLASLEAPGQLDVTLRASDPRVLREQ